jgi:DNA replication protein DnaC
MVCAYVRVSTNHDDQLSSFQSQAAYYQDKFSQVSDRIVVGIFSDAGISGAKENRPTRYVQLPDLLEELHMAKAKGPEQFHRLRKQYVKYDLLIIDEWLLFPISEGDAQILLSLIDRRHNFKATIIASQYEPAEWLDQIPIPVTAEAITDRLSAQAYRITLDSKNSMRLMR